MKVTFTKHAAERMLQRFNINMQPQQTLDITSTFTVATTYTYKTKKCLVFVATKSKKPMLIIAVKTSAQTADVLTVYNSASPFLRECYAKANVAVPLAA